MLTHPNQKEDNTNLYLFIGLLLFKVISFLKSDYMDEKDLIEWKNIPNLNEELEKAQNLERSVSTGLVDKTELKENGGVVEIPKILPTNEELMKQYKDIKKIEKLGIKLDSTLLRKKTILEEYLELSDDIDLDDVKTNLIFEDCNPDEFFDYKKFISKRLGDFIMNEVMFKTFGGKIYYYKNGVYIDKGEEIIEGLVNLALKDRFKKHLAEETKFYIKTASYVEHNDPEKHIINIKNGLFDLNKMELKPHDPDIFMITQLPVSYNENAKCKKIEEFVSEIVVEEDASLIQEFVGYCLWKEYYIHKAFMLVGSGANGKTTFMGLLKSFLGEKNIASTKLENLENSRFASARFHGKLANISSELVSTALHKTSNFKALTGGDTINAENKFGGEFNYVNYAKMIFACNDLPESRDDTDAYFRRWIILNFPYKFEGEDCDPNIIDKLTTDEELSGMFNWALEGLKRLLDKGRFSSSKTTDETKEQMKRMASPVHAFRLDWCEEGSEKEILKRDFYNAYKEYCTIHNLPLVQENSFARKLLAIKDLRLQEIKHGTKRYWKGITLRDDIDFECEKRQDIQVLDKFNVKNKSIDKPKSDLNE
jgi:putative DNA primase/helicase